MVEYILRSRLYCAPLICSMQPWKHIHSKLGNCFGNIWYNKPLFDEAVKWATVVNICFPYCLAYISIQFKCILEPYKWRSAKQEVFVHMYYFILLRMINNECISIHVIDSYYCDLHKLIIYVIKISLEYYLASKKCDVTCQ